MRLILRHYLKKHLLARLSEFPLATVGRQVGILSDG
jgi:hypothetical protein